MNCANRQNSGHEITGLVIILIGFGLLLHTLGIFPFGNLVSRFWLPALFVFIGVFHLSRNRGPQGVAGGVFWIGFGVLFFLSQTNLFSFNPWRLIGPAIVIWIGLSILLSRAGARGVPGTSSAGVESGDWMSATAILGSFERKSTSLQFRGGDLTAIMGGGNVDFRDANIGPEDTATLNVSVVMGGLEIFVPASWAVESLVTPILGGYEDKTRAPKEGVKRLVIRGGVVLGGVEVKN